MRALRLALTLWLLASPALAEAPKPFVQGSWQSIQDAHAGQPLAVHLWSLTCAPCLVELPLWARLAKDHPHLRIVLISTDPAEDAPRMAATLARAGLSGLESWHFADPFADRLRFELDPKWRGELPRTLLVAPGGQVTAVRGSDMAAVQAWAAGTHAGQ